jgi:hypothetical protein
MPDTGRAIMLSESDVGVKGSADQNPDQVAAWSGQQTLSFSIHKLQPKLNQAWIPNCTGHDAEVRVIRSATRPVWRTELRVIE